MPFTRTPRACPYIISNLIKEIKAFKNIIFSKIVNRNLRSRILDYYINASNRFSNISVKLA